MSAVLNTPPNHTSGSNGAVPSKIEFIDLKAQYRALKSDIDARIQKVLDHGQYIMGPEVVELEQKLAAYTGSKHCITCSSGTEALLMSMMALGIGRGDEVITTPFTFAATAEMIVLAGATPVFVDIERDTCLMDVSKIAAKITPRTKAIMPVSLYGQVCDMDAINALAARHGNIAVIEDAAQSFGASYSGESGVKRKSGNLSTIGCTSFFPSKPLGCYGDGGAIFTNDDALAKAMREIRVHGQERRYYHTRVGVGGRMDTLQCAIVLAKLERFDWEIERRLDLGKKYSQALTLSGVTAKPVTVRPDRDCVWAQFTVLVEGRAELQSKLQAVGVPTAIHYPLSLNRQPAYRNDVSAEETVNSHWAADRVMSLPMSADLDELTLQRVVDSLAHHHAG
jgi:UDP-2-acetamido-2-deoxy-ribo-hexuluronate aminotransferase